MEKEKGWTQYMRSGNLRDKEGIRNIYKLQEERNLRTGKKK